MRPIDEKPHHSTKAPHSSGKLPYVSIQVQEVVQAALAGATSTTISCRLAGTHTTLLARKINAHDSRPGPLYEIGRRIVEKLYEKSISFDGSAGIRLETFPGPDEKAYAPGGDGLSPQPVTVVWRNPLKGGREELDCISDGIESRCREERR